MPGRVLIVDDDVDILDLRRNHLTRNGWTAHTINAAVELQAAYPRRDHGPQLVDAGLTHMLARPLDLKLSVNAMMNPGRAAPEESEV